MQLVLAEVKMKRGGCSCGSRKNTNRLPRRYCPRVGGRVSGRVIDCVDLECAARHTGDAASYVRDKVSGYGEIWSTRLFCRY
jgi:hypothetical protein